MTFRWVDLGNGRSVFRRIEGRPTKRATIPMPYVATDTMEPTQHPCTGEHFTSKAKFRQVTRAHNCEEMGNDPARLRPKKKTMADRQGIRKTLKKAAEIYGS